jgi:type VI secretion system secreted protein VgrG
MALTALKDITVTSTDGKIILNAAREIWIGAGGSYIKISAEGIDNVSPGQILERCASWEKQGAIGAQRQKQTFFESQKPLLYSQQLILDEALHKPDGVATLTQYIFIDQTGAILGSGTIDENGKTLRAFTDSPQQIKAVLDLNQGKWTTLTYKDPFPISSNETDKTDAGVFDYADHEKSDDSDECSDRSTET